MKYIVSFYILIIPTHSISPESVSEDTLVKDIYTYISWLEQEVTEKSQESLSYDNMGLGDSRCLWAYYKLWIAICTLTLNID